MLQAEWRPGRSRPNECYFVLLAASKKIYIVITVITRPPFLTHSLTHSYLSQSTQREKKWCIDLAKRNMIRTYYVNQQYPGSVSGH